MPDQIMQFPRGHLIVSDRGALFLMLIVNISKNVLQIPVVGVLFAKNFLSYSYDHS
jgi:hypothetical protein